MRLNEGVYDRWTFKAVFLAGGPGSGKTVTKKKLLHNFKDLDPDALSVLKMKKEKISTDFSKRTKEEEKRRDEIHTQAKEQMLGGRQKSVINGRLPVVIDRTGADFPGLEMHKKMLEGLGYETKMIFIDTPIEIAASRNIQRPRKMRPDLLKNFHKMVRSNVEKFKRLFGGDFYRLDGTKPISEMKEELNVMWKKIAKWMDRPVKNKAAEEWRSQETGKRKAKIEKGAKRLKDEINRTS